MKNKWSLTRDWQIPFSMTLYVGAVLAEHAANSTPRERMYTSVQTIHQWLSPFCLMMFDPSIVTVRDSVKENLTKEGVGKTSRMISGKS